MVRTVFNRIETANENMEFSVKVSMCEIYNEKIKDLLDPRKDNLKIHEEKGKESIFKMQLKVGAQMRVKFIKS